MKELKGNIAIYGAGGIGLIVLNALRKLNILPVCFIDKNKFQESLDGIDIISPYDINKKNIDVVLVGIFSHPRECDLDDIVSYLESFGIKNIISFEELYQKLPDIFIENNYWIAPISYFEREKEKIDKARGIFKDEKSINIFDSQIAHRLGASYKILPKPDFDYVQYLPSDIPIPKGPCKFIDIGACDGDTILQFKESGIEFDKIAAFEPDIKNFQKLVNNLSDNIAPQLFLFPSGVGSECLSLAFEENGNGSSSYSSKGANRIPIVSIDNVLKGFEPNYIKMDVEGFEKHSIIGLKNTIEKYRPTLAISVYHLPDDLYSIPIYLYENFDNYNFYLRMHCSHCFDTVLYAVAN